MNTGVLYLSYDGVLEPLGQSQVVAYLEQLAGDYAIHLVAFEKQTDLDDTSACLHVSARLSRAGIHWHPRTCHKRPSALATAWDIFRLLAVSNG